jgi:hypothetical protein
MVKRRQRNNMLGNFRTDFTTLLGKRKIPIKSQCRKQMKNPWCFGEQKMRAWEGAFFEERTFYRSTAEKGG